MFNSKINGDLTEEYKSLEEYKAQVVKSLKKTVFHSKFIWTSLTVAIALLNISLIVLASIALDKVLSERGIGGAAETIAVAALTILSFVVMLITTIYQGLMRAKVYGKAAEYIQVETMKWTKKHGEYASKDADKIFKKRIESIVKTTKGVKNKVSVKRALIKILTGGQYE